MSYHIVVLVSQQPLFSKNNLPYECQKVFDRNVIFTFVDFVGGVLQGEKIVISEKEHF